jgi:hypothetical protein
MTGPAMPSRRPKEPKMNLMLMLRNNSKSRRARSESKPFEESTGKKREYHPFRQYTEIKEVTYPRTGNSVPLRADHCKCNALCRILAGQDYKRLEFFGTHDQNSHANDASQKLKYNQIGAIYDSVLIAPK